MIDIIITGIIIGILVSAPTGPLGILCIQRTLHKGRLHGFVTGLGASTSDIIYAILVGFSMNFIIEFVEQYRFIIQIVGSIILLLFGYIIYSNNPEEELADKKIGTSNRNLFSTYTSAFGLCFSNPIIIFFFNSPFCQIQIFLSLVQYLSSTYRACLDTYRYFDMVAFAHYDSRNIPPSLQSERLTHTKPHYGWSAYAAVGGGCSIGAIG